MIVDPEHDRVAELLGVYALDAVEPDECALVEQHLAECPRCRAEVDVLRQVAADLAIGGGLDSERPPAAVWDRIEAGIGATDTHIRPIMTLTSDVPGRARRGARRRLSGRRAAWLGGAVAGAAAAAIAALAVGLANTQGQVDQLQSALAGRGSKAAVHAALASPGHRVAELRSSDGARLAEVVLLRDGVGYVVRSTMTRLPATETYQLWASINGQPISLGLLGRQLASGAAFSLGTSAASARELMVTIEPSGGVVTPGRSPVATAPLSLS